MISRILLVLGLVYVCSGQIQDQTRVPEASGSAVVEAVINLIHQSCIFPSDKLYLRRLAYVESKDGTANDTYRAGYYGGIWQIDRDQFLETQNSGFLNTARALLRNTLAIDWSTARWEDLRKPLYSGMAAALYTLLKVGAGTFPSSVEEQSSFWINTTKHTNLEANKYYKAVNELQGGCRSTNAIDLVFVLDSSASLSPTDFDITKQFVADVVDQFDIGPQNVRVGVVRYSTAISVSFLLNQFNTKDAVKKAVDGIQYSPGGTKTAAAIDKAVNEVFSTLNGARNGAAKVMVLITDGRSENTSNTLTAAKNARMSGITIFTLGVTQNVNKTELDGIASAPSCTHSYIVNSFSDLDSLKTELQSVSCKGLGAKTTVATSQGNCSHGWVNFKDSCYMFSHTVLSWPDAEEACKIIHGTMVTVHTAEEQMFLKSYLNRKHAKDYPAYAYWIGGNDLEVENEWQWSVIGQPVNYTDWGPAEPSSRAGEDCLVLWGPFKFQWGDYHCNVPRNFVCQRRMSTTPTANPSWIIFG
ncbi:collagen alpha-1(XII) chain-like [Argopecten irradians]|uniref:collagen alpha-1(XII) chain-like n=1 Tax=Argopecten irradians TaxID=31199 RepID=UPI00371A2893